MPDDLAPAPAEYPTDDGFAVLDDQQSGGPSPIQSEGPDAPAKVKAPAEPKAKPSIAESLKAAAEKVEAKEAGKPVKPEAKPAEKPVDPKAPARGERGQFARQALEAAEAGEAGAEPAAKPQTAPDPNNPTATPPRRFTPEAQAEWNNTPDPVKAEVHRAVSEMERGIETYRQRQKELDPVAPFIQQARAQGLEPAKVVEGYVRTEALLQQDLVGGLDHICRRMGVQGGLQELVMQLVGIQPDPAQRYAREAQTAVSGEVQQVRQQLSQMQQMLQQQKHETEVTKTLSYVESFARQVGVERFAELEEAIMQEIALGFDLNQAYERANRLNPGSARAAHTLNGQKSIAGAPAPGRPTTPAKTPAKSTRAALENAFKEVGVRS